MLEQALATAQIKEQITGGATGIKVQNVMQLITITALSSTNTSSLPQVATIT